MQLSEKQKHTFCHGITSTDEITYEVKEAYEQYLLASI